MRGLVLCSVLLAVGCKGKPDVSAMEACKKGASAEIGKRTREIIEGL